MLGLFPLPSEAELACLLLTFCDFSVIAGANPFQPNCSRQKEFRSQNIALETAFFDFSKKSQVLC